VEFNERLGLCIDILVFNPEVRVVGKPNITATNRRPCDDYIGCCLAYRRKNTRILHASPSSMESIDGSVKQAESTMMSSGVHVMTASESESTDRAAVSTNDDDDDYLYYTEASLVNRALLSSVV